jgi:hypothetical protein
LQKPNGNKIFKKPAKRTSNYFEFTWDLN